MTDDSTSPSVRIAVECESIRSEAEECKKEIAKGINEGKITLADLAKGIEQIEDFLKFLKTLQTDAGRALTAGKYP